MSTEPKTVEWAAHEAFEIERIARDLLDGSGLVVASNALSRSSRVVVRLPAEPDLFMVGLAGCTPPRPLDAPPPDARFFVFGTARTFLHTPGEAGRALALEALRAASSRVSIMERELRPLRDALGRASRDFLREATQTIEVPDAG